MENDFLLYDDDEEYDSMDMYSDDMWDDDDENVHFDIHRVTFSELVETCVRSTLKDIVNMIGKLLIYCIVFRFTTLLVELPKTVVHLTSILMGLLALQTFAQHNLVYVLLLCALGYISLIIVHFTTRKNYGGFSAIAVVCFLIICEVFLVESKNWHVIRGIQMVLSTKIISLAFDLDKKVIDRLPSVLEVTGYYLCVGNLIFGPWTSFDDYTKATRKNSLCRRWFLKLAMSSTLAVAFLLASTCFCHWLIPEHSNKWLLVYRDALAFRSSHYFVSFVSEVTAVSAGFGSHNGGWDIKVSQPQHVEVPRSLTEVVVHWNMPIHHWLKTYVFKNFQPLHPFAAIFFTYAASSLLHGLNFQLAAVLLSLGFYTFIEYNFRKKLAIVFDACIAARRCSNSSCHHFYKSNNFVVVIANIAFGILAMFHLAYLGVMFDSSNSQQDEGYSMQHTLSKWNDLNFASHWVTVATYLIHWLI